MSRPWPLLETTCPTSDPQKRSRLSHLPPGHLVNTLSCHNITIFHIIYIITIFYTITILCTDHHPDQDHCLFHHRRWSFPLLLKSRKELVRWWTASSRGFRTKPTGNVDSDYDNDDDDDIYYDAVFVCLSRKIVSFGLVMMMMMMVNPWMEKICKVVFDDQPFAKH